MLARLTIYQNPCASVFHNSSMTIILTNDDGIDAPGIRALEKAIAEETVIVAPNKQYSGCGHQVTTQRGIKLAQKKHNEYSILIKHS